MGGDGGVKATQRRFMRGTTNYTEQKSEVLNVKEQRVRRSKYCAQSGNLLQEPIAACELGHLFNKDGLIRALLNKELNDRFSHIRGLKDIKTLSFHPNPSYLEETSKDEEDRCKYACPVTLLPFNGIYNFVVLWSSGKVLSEKAVKEIGVQGLQAEYGPFTEADIVPLLPSEEDESESVSMMLKRRAAAAANKEKKVSKKHGEESDHASKKMRVEGPQMKVSIGGTSSMVKSAQDLVAKQEEGSSVFKKLFHKDKEVDKKARDLFMGVAGLRYSVL